MVYVTHHWFLTPETRLYWFTVAGRRGVHEVDEH